MKHIASYGGFDIYANPALNGADFEIRPGRELIQMDVATANGAERLLLTHAQVYALHEQCLRQMMYGQRSNGLNGMAGMLGGG
jgi:hypothetical protein